MQFSFRKPHFWHPQNFAKTLFWHSVTLFVFSKMPKNTIKLGKNSKKNLDQFLTLDLDQFLTLETPNLGPVFNSTAYIYIYICCRVKTWSKNSHFLSQNLVQVFSFFSFFVFQKSSSFCRANEIFKKNEQKKEKLKHFFWVKTWSNFVAQHTWTKFWRNLGPSFDSTFLLILGYFYLFEKMLKPLFL